MMIFTHNTQKRRIIFFIYIIVKDKEEVVVEIHPYRENFLEKPACQEYKVYDSRYQLLHLETYFQSVDRSMANKKNSLMNQ